jgi:hypothetical protein
LHAHVRHFQIAGITIRVESDLPVTDATFSAALRAFETDKPGDDMVVVRHHFRVTPPIPGFASSEGAEEVYRKPPWAIYRTPTGWLYHGISDDPDDPPLGVTALFNADYSLGDIYDSDLYADVWSRGGVSSLTLFSTDQILVAPLLADRQACLLHSAGLVIDDEGLLFVGHSDAGKSTTTQLVSGALGSRVTILCDDRNIVRSWPEGFEGGRPGFYVHGTWSHGDVPVVSSRGASLRAVLFLEQATVNELVPLPDRSDVWPRLLATLIKPFATSYWWNRQLDVLEALAASVPCYTMRFDRSGAIAKNLEELVR